MSTAVRSHAKINLGLAIGAPRPDGFHALSTVYQTLEAYDVVTVEARPAAATALTLSSNDERVPTDGRNTAWKMVEQALAALETTAEVRIHIEKKLPVQGGLGAGSANAVAALVGLEAELQVWSEEKKKRWWQAKRLEIGARVGSDVPLFLLGGAVLGLDRGQEVYPLPDFAPLWCAVATPSVGVSTPTAFRDWDALCAREGLTAEASTGKLSELSRAYASAFAGVLPVGGESGSGLTGVPHGDPAATASVALVRTGVTSWIENDFERVVFPQQPSLAAIKQILAEQDSAGATVYASLSGSGSALFGLYETREAAQAACRRLAAAGVAGFMTRTLPRSTYWQQMLEPRAQ